MDSTKDVKSLLEAQGVQNYYDSYISGNRIQVPGKDSIFKLPAGAVYGPYVDGNNFTLAKLIGTRVQPDTVKIRHILIATMQQDQQTGQAYQVRDTAVAYKLIDSLRTAIRNGTSFDSIVVKFSEDPGSKEKGGVYEGVPSGQMVPDFNEFIFGNPVGAKGIVKTEFGYHYIEILSAKGASTAYKVAYLSNPITASSETDNNANNEAAQFAATSNDQKNI
ncbi:MAG: peptidylprolyl isomerase [Chitinophagaceae bacterium]